MKNNLVPSGKILNVTGTKFDYRNFKPIGENRIDDYYVLNKSKEAVACIFDPNSKIKMEVYTNQPGIVIFTGLSVASWARLQSSTKNKSLVLTGPRTVGSNEE